MPDFLELLESFDGQVRNARTLFTREDGIAVASGRNRLHGRVDPVTYKKNLAEAINFLSDIVSGRRHYSLFNEVMTTDDFPQYFGDILDRTLLASYAEWPAGWEAYAKRAVVNDFRDAKLIPPVYGADGPLDEVKEAAPYPDADLSEQTPILWRVKKYGRRVPFSWETIVNDDLGQLQDIPRRLARAARRTEHRLVTSLFVGTSGPLSTMYHNDYGNIVNTTNGSPTAVGNNPALSINALQAAYIVLSKMVDETGEPIYRDMLTLVVPPALEVTAMNILNAISIQDSSLLGGGQPDDHEGSGERRLIVNNWLRGRLRVVVDPYIPLLATSANGNTTWFLFSDPYTSLELDSFEDMSHLKFG
jgi:hypothetical protein